MFLIFCPSHSFNNNHCFDFHYVLVGIETIGKAYACAMRPLSLLLPSAKRWKGKRHFQYIRPRGLHHRCLYRSRQPGTSHSLSPSHFHQLLKQDMGDHLIFKLLLFFCCKWMWASKRLMPPPCDYVIAAADCTGNYYLYARAILYLTDL